MATTAAGALASDARPAAPASRVAVAAHAGARQPHAGDRQRITAESARRRTAGQAARALRRHQRVVVLGRSARAGEATALRGGRAQAFSVTARASGTARAVRIFVGRRSRARRLLVGLYAGGRSHPTVRLASGALGVPSSGAWVTVRIRSAALRAGRGYWLAVLGVGGRLAVRTGASHSCASETSAQADLTSLPARWRSGARTSDCALAASVTGVPLAQTASLGGTATPSGSTRFKPHPPRLESAPVVSGTQQEGDVLQTSNGSWFTSTSTVYTYAWEDCDSSGSACTAIPGATAATHLLGASDVGHTIRSVVTATDLGGSTSATSAATATITALTESVTSGATGGTGGSTGGTGGSTGGSSAGSGGSLTELVGATALAPTADSNIAGTAQAFQYVATASGTTSDIQLYVTSATTATTVIVGIYSDSGGRPGTLLASGQSTTVTPGAWNEVPIASATLTAGTAYWLALLGTGGQLDYLDTAGGSSASYVESTTGLSSLPASYSPGTEYNVSPASLYVQGTVTATLSPPADTAPPTVSGTAQVGDVLSTTTGSWSNSPTSYAYQWEACDTAGAGCSAISGATASTFTIASSYAGDTLRAQVTATNAVGSSSATSAQTAVVASSSGGGSGTDPQVYVAQTATGTGNGSSCSNAEPVSWFDSSSSWGTSAGQIGPSTTVNLCGTISTALVAYGSGTSSAPITIAWQPGATLSSPNWNQGAAINTNGQHYLTFNGEDNGVSIQATALGSGLADQGQHAQGIWALNCTGCTFENLTIANLYVHTSPSDTSVDQTMDNAIVFSGSDLTIADNTIHDVGWALYSRWNNGDSNDTIYGNDIYNVDHGFASTSGFAGGSIGPIYFYDNHLHDYANWDTTSDAYHHDGVHCYTSDGGAGASHYAGLYIYDNRFDGTVGQDATGQIFMEGGSSSSSTPCADSTSNVYIFNNVISSSDTPTDNAYMGTASIAGGVYNNTVMGASNTDNVGGCAGYSWEQAGAEIAFENNVLSNCDNLVTQSGSPNGAFVSGSPDYNVYADGGSNSFTCGTSSGTTNFYNFGQFSSWQSCLESDTGGTAPGFDQHSKTASSALLNSDGSPQAGSPVTGAGANLTSLCQGQPTPGLGALCTTYTGPPAGGGAGSTTAGAPRPTSGSWDAGAY